jgi:hypothetical protein
MGLKGKQNKNPLDPFLLIKKEKHKLKIVWKKPNVDKELGEYFENPVTKRIFKSHGLVFNSKKELRDFLENGKVFSFNKYPFNNNNAINMTFSDREFNTEISDKWYAASYISMLETIVKDGKINLDMPIIIKFDKKFGKLYYGFAGNRRTNLARRCGINFSFWIVEQKA